MLTSSTSTDDANPTPHFFRGIFPVLGELSTTDVTHLDPGSEGSTSPRHQSGTQFPADNTQNKIYPDITDEILSGH